MKLRVNPHCQDERCRDGIIRLSQGVLESIKVKLGEYLELDLQMVGGGATIHKVEQRVGDEVI